MPYDHWALCLGNDIWQRYRLHYRETIIPPTGFFILYHCPPVPMLEMHIAARFWVHILPLQNHLNLQPLPIPGRIMEGSIIRKREWGLQLPAASTGLLLISKHSNLVDRCYSYKLAGWYTSFNIYCILYGQFFLLCRYHAIHTYNTIISTML